MNSNLLSDLGPVRRATGTTRLESRFDCRRAVFTLEKCKESRGVEDRHVASSATASAPTFCEQFFDEVQVREIGSYSSLELAAGEHHEPPRGLQKDQP